LGGTFEVFFHGLEVAGHLVAGLAAHGERHDQLADAVAFEIDRDRQS
jgi:hypothetical protein